MKGSELALVFFTLFIQAAVGLLITAGIVNSLSGWKNEIAISRGMNEKILFLVLALFTAGLIISFLHLGNVKNAYYALNNITTSWLSREILFVIVFGFFTLLFTLVYVKNLFPPLVQNIVLLFALLSGITLIWVMAKVYMIEIVPAWNSFNTPASFYLSAFTLGAITFFCAAVFHLNRQGVNILSTPAAAGIVKMIVAVILILLTAELVVRFIHLFSLSGGDRAARESLGIILNENIILVAAVIICQAICIFLLSKTFTSLGKGILNTNYLFTGFVILLIAEVIGRYLFYAVFNRTGI